MHTSISSRLASLSIAFTMTFVMLVSINTLAVGDADAAHIAGSGTMAAASAAASAAQS